MDVQYSAGSVVWVKLEGGRWWPGEITDESDCPDVTKGLRKPPLAIVKFFDEDCFHIVKSEQHIYPFDCEKKDEFLRRGKDFKMSGKDNFSLRLKFEADVSKAESMRKPLSKSSPTEKSSPLISTILKGSKYVSYMKFPPAERFDYGAAGSVERESYESSSSPYTTHTTGKAAITPEPSLPRIRKQPSTPKPREASYACDTCGFQTSRMDNFIRHHKSHSDPYRFHSESPRFINEKHGSGKSRKRKSKDGSKGGQKVVRRSKKNADPSGVSTPGAKKRKRNEDRTTDDNRSAPKKKKRKVASLDRKPFSNPFEDEEDENAANKSQEESPVKGDEQNTDPDAAAPNHDEDDAESDVVLDDSKPAEKLKVEWEDFIKGSPLPINTTTTTAGPEITQSDSLKEDKSDDEEEFALMSQDSAALLYDKTLPEKETQEVEDVSKEGEIRQMDDETLPPSETRLNDVVMDPVRGENGVDDDTDPMAEDDEEEEEEVVDNKVDLNSKLKTDEKDEKVVSEEKAISEDVISDENAISEENVISVEETTVSEENAISVEETAVPEENAVSEENAISGEEIAGSEENAISGEEIAVSEENAISGEEIAVSEDNAVSEENAISGEEIAVSEDNAVSGEEIAVSEENAISGEETAVSEENVISEETAVSDDKMEVEEEKESEDQQANGNIVVESDVVKSPFEIMEEVTQAPILSEEENYQKPPTSHEHVEETTVAFEECIEEPVVAHVNLESSPIHDEMKSVDVVMVETPLPMPTPEELPGGEIVLDMSGDMTTEEIVVTDGSLHAVDIMVGEEIEVQEIEIQSDGMHTTEEIVLGSEVVMQLLPDDRISDNSHHGILESMVPHPANNNNEIVVPGFGDEGFERAPPVPPQSVLNASCGYDSDHSLMAAAVPSRDNANSDDYLAEELVVHQVEPVNNKSAAESIFDVIERPFDNSGKASKTDASLRDHEMSGADMSKLQSVEGSNS